MTNFLERKHHFPSNFFFLVATLLLSLNFMRPFGLAISDWLYFVAFGLAFLETIFCERKHFHCWIKNRLIWPALLIIFGAVISLLRTQIIHVAVLEIVQQIYVITLFISLTWIMVRRNKTKIIIFAFIISGVFTASVAAVDYWTGSIYGPILSGKLDINLWSRYAGTLGHPNKFGYFLVLTTLLSIGYFSSLKKWRLSSLFLRVLWIVFIVVQLFGIYLSNSMTAFLGLLLGLLALVISSKIFLYKATRAIIIVIILGVLAFAINVVFNLEPMTSEINNITLAWDRVLNITAGSRILIYEQAWKKILQNPLVGAGYDQISTSGVDIIQIELGGTIHNALLQIWYIGGLFAFIGWFATYILIGLSAFIALMEKVAKSPLISSLAAATLALILMDQFQDAIYQREKWLIIGLLLGYTWEKKRGFKV